MWIYQQPALLNEADALSPVNALALPEPVAEKPPAPEPTSEPEPPIVKAAAHREKRMTSLAKRFSKTDCWMLVGAFLIGSAAAGALQALSGAKHAEWLNYYLSSWLEMFSVAGAHSPAMLFAAEYLTLLGVATVLLLLGFSAFGPVLIFFFMMLYGAGNGLLFSAAFAGTSPAAKVLLVVLTALPSSAAAACLCILGAAALRVSGRIRAYSFLSSSSEPCRPRAGILMGQYLLTLTAFLPLCGAATGLAYLEIRLF